MRLEALQGNQEGNRLLREMGCPKRVTSIRDGRRSYQSQLDPHPKRARIYGKGPTLGNCLQVSR